MEEEFKRIYDCMRASEVIADGEYFVIHADHLHDFKMAIEYYFNTNNRVKKIDTFKTKTGTYLEPYQYSFIPIERSPLDINEEVFLKKINEIVDKINEMEDK